MESTKFKAAIGILRLSMGLTFLWAFFDKLLGLGFATIPEKAWLVGSSPTAGFLQFGVRGPFANFYHSLANIPAVDWLFMLGLFFIGATLTLGIMTRLGSFAGFIMLVLMYTAVGITPENHPFIDDHFIYAIVMLLFMFADTGKYFGLANQWANTSLVQKFRILK